MESTIFDINYTLLDNPDDYAEAAVGRNNYIKWVKFDFTDDQPNGNKMKVPQTEFANIIRTGVHMPIKMQDNDPNGDHEGSTPVGVITNLAQKGNKVIGLGALWKEERKEAVEALAENFNSGNPPKLSWEVFYSESEVDEEGIESLTGVTVRATTFVGDPAYKGRTNVVAMASNEDAKKEQSSENNKEAKLDELKALQEQFDSLKSEKELLETRASELNTEIETLKSRNEELTTWKSQREEGDAKAQLLTTRRESLLKAGVTLTDEEWATKAESVAAMDETTFDFYTQEVAVFASKKASEEAAASKKEEADNTKIPAGIGSTETRTPYEILREALNENRGEA